MIDVQFAIIKPDGLRVSNKGCAVLFDACSYGGNALEICDKSNNLKNDGFTGQVKSVYVPDGKVLTLYDNEN